MPEAAHLHVDGAVESVRRAAPCPVEELVAREHPLGPRDETVQEIALGAGERDLGSRLADGDGAAREVDDKVGDGEPFGRGFHRGGGAIGATQDRADAGQQDAGAERLRHIVVGTHLQAEHLVGVLVLGGQYDDRRAGRLAQAAADGEPVLAKKHPVEDDEVRPRSRREQAVEACASVEGDDAKAFFLPVAGELAADVVVVLDDGNGGAVCHAPRIARRGGAATQKQTSLHIVTRFRRPVTSGNGTGAMVFRIKTGPSPGREKRK